MSEILDRTVIHEMSRGPAPMRAEDAGMRRARFRAMMRLSLLVFASSAGLIAAVSTGSRRPIAAARAADLARKRGGGGGRSSQAEAATPTETRGPALQGAEPSIQPPESPAPRPNQGEAHAPAPDRPPTGNELFARRWIPEDPRCHGGDGLGPVYNAASCLDCHGLGAPGGAGPARRNVELVTGIGYIVRSDVPMVIGGMSLSGNTGDGPNGELDVNISPDRADLVKIHPGFRTARSSVLHRYGAAPEYDRWRQDAISELRFYNRVVSEFRGTGVMVARSTRNPTPLFGAALIDALPAAAFEEAARHQPSGIRGRVHRMKDGQIGRFGWKAQVATLREFVLTACANEMGLEVPGHHQAASPLDPDAKPGRLDLTQDECDALVAYVGSLPPPAVLVASGPEESADIEEGRRLFQSTGCAGCHTPSLGTIRDIYSDLLLHDMGPALSDPGNYYDSDEPGSRDAPKASDWRTPPLWGIRDSGPYLHDGRARTLAGAVALHGGQGKAAARAFRMLSSEGRSQVKAFLNSLVAPAGSEVPSAAAAEGDTERRAEEAIERAEEEARDAEVAFERAAEAFERAEESARRISTRLHAAATLDRMGKIRGAVNFYRAIIREAPDSPAGREAAARIAVLEGRSAGGLRGPGSGVTDPSPGQR